MNTPFDDHLGSPPMHPDVHAWLEELDVSERTELERTWVLAELGRDPEPAAHVTQGAWEALRQEGLTHPSPEPQRRRSARARERPAHLRMRRLVPWVTVTASVIAILSMGLWWMGGTQHIRAPHGSTVTHALPDGSTVVLNSGSSLTYARALRGNERRVELEGEAYFSVQSGERPFVVHTFNAAVTVVGTQFNVRAWADVANPETVVVLEEGRVRFAAAEEPEGGVMLEQGHMSRLAAHAQQPSRPEPIDVTRALAWRRGGFFFNNAPLRTIIAEVERRFAVSIRITDTAIAQDSVVLFLHQADNAEVLLNAISQFRGYTFRATANGYELLPPQ